MSKVQELYDHVARSTTGPKRGFSGWLERRDIAALWELLDPAAGQTALDVGCGLGVHADALKRAGLTVWATDLSPAVIERIAPRVDHARVADLAALDLGRTFDRILCVGVLDFVADPPRCITNLARHLRPGGRLVIEVPRRSLGGYSFQWWYRQARKIDINVFSEAELDAMARREGLSLVGVRRPFLHSLFMGWTRESR